MEELETKIIIKSTKRKLISAIKKETTNKINELEEDSRIETVNSRVKKTPPKKTKQKKQWVLK